MMKVMCAEKLEAAKAFADGLGPEARKALDEKLDYLANYRDGTCLCELYVDFAPYSFAFTLYGPEDAAGNRARWFNGGLIYFGPRETGVGAPQLSVSITGSMGGPDANKPRWEVHT